MTLITTSKLVAAGTPPTYAAAAAGDTATVGEKLFLHVKNGGGSSINVTIAVPGSGPNGIANPDTVVAIAAGADAWIPLDTYYADPSDGKAHIGYSATASVTRAVIHR